MDSKTREVLILYNQLKNLRGDVEKIEPEAANRAGHPGSGITAFILPFNSLLERAKELLSDDSLALKPIAQIEPVREIQERLAADYHKRAKFQILVGSGSLLAALEPYLRSAVELPSMKIAREGVFFAGQYFDAIQQATEIFSLAEKSIVIIDGYISQDVLNLLTSKKPSVEVRILSKSLPDALVASASAFNKQYGGLSIRISETFHDRFVIIDEIDFYHFGASIKDLGNRGFMFSRIEEPAVIKVLWRVFSEEWSRATHKI